LTDIDEAAIKAHRKLGGKLNIEPADTLDSAEKLSLYYTPGVGAVSRYISEHPESAQELTGIGRTVAVVSDGSAILGLGNLGPQPALPVMEGKAMLFQRFSGLNSIPIVLDVHTADEIVATTAAIAPSFGGINLEDIAAPICFEVESRLKEMLSIPVFHDDQHGTAVVILAGLINAAKVVDKKLESLRVVVIGAGAAGHAVSMLLVKADIKNVIVTDREGIISRDRPNLRADKRRLADKTNPDNKVGDLASALKGADVVVGVSGPNTLNKNMISEMTGESIIFALSNPDPEIMPDEAKAGGAAVIATGRSDFPNQVNNALVFPAIFRGALDNKVSQITDDHKIAAAKVLAGLIKSPTADEIIPKISDTRILKAVSSVIR